MSTDNIDPRVRSEVLSRDGYRCRRCGDVELAALTLHHVTYRSQGGGHEADNLVTVCWPCHALVHSKFVTVARINGHWFFGDTRHWRNRYR